MVVEDDPQSLAKRIVDAEDPFGKNMLATATTPPPPVIEKAMTAVSGVEAKVAAQTGTSSRPILELVDYDSEVTRLREVSLEIEKQSTLVAQLSQVKSSTCLHN